MRLSAFSLTLIAVALIATAPSSARAQGAVAFQPVVRAFPNGITMGVTPVVSADRRYVRLGLQPQFVALSGFQTYTIPAAVRSGAPNGAAGGLPGGAGAGAAGFPSVGLGPNMGPGYQIPRFNPAFQSAPRIPPQPQRQPRLHARSRSKPRRP